MPENPDLGLRPTQLRFLRLEPERSLTEKLDLAVAALQAVCKEDGPGCDLSSAGPCFHIAAEALHKIVIK